MADLDEFVARVRAEYPGCFACGDANPVGLHLGAARLDGDEALADFTPVEHHAGAGETLHGGLAATVLDELMVWAGLLIHRVLSVTATLELRYRRPVLVTDRIEVRGRVDDVSGRRLRCSGRILVNGEPAVTAGGLYLVSRTFVPSAETP